MIAIEYRVAVADDIDFLVSVLDLADCDRLSHNEDWDREQHVARCRAHTLEETAGKVEHSITCVVEVDGAPVGRLRVVRPGDHLYLAGIQILPVHQGKGIGSEAVRSVMTEAQSKGLPLQLEVEKENPHAKRLYLRLGFRVVEDRGTKELMEIAP